MKITLIAIATVLLAGVGFFVFRQAPEATNTTVTTTTENSNTQTNTSSTNTSPLNQNSATNVNVSLNTNTVVNVNTSTPSTKTVTVTSSGFSPKSLTIEAGDSVVWQNNSGGDIYVAPDSHPTHTNYQGVWDDNGAGEISNGSSYRFTFTKTGTYNYHDHLDDFTRGTIIVQ